MALYEANNLRMMQHMNENRFIISHSMASGLDVIGDRWALLILRDAFLGRSRFEEFRQYTGASKTTLTRRLSSLLNADVLYKRSYSSSGTRFDYKLTEKGAGLFFASLLCWQWESEWTEKGAEELPARLFHRKCGHVMEPRAVCHHCREEFHFGDVKWSQRTVLLDHQLQDIQSFNKRRVRSSAPNDQQDFSLSQVSDLIGDRWTLLILIASFFGLNRYDEYVKKLKIASNILVDRLNLLIHEEVMTRHQYQENPPRSEYHLTQKGKSLYLLVMSIRQWAIDWLPQPQTSEQLIHADCDHALVVDVVCRHCGDIPIISDVDFVNLSES